MDTVQRRPPILVNAVTRKPVPVLCQSADTCLKHRCVLKYYRVLENCDGYVRRKMTMKLIRLKLKNFKGCRDFELNTEGNNINIYGDNATGKTTLADSFMWLLFDKDSHNKKDFEIKTLGPDGESEHGLEHTVEVELEINGRPLVLKKVYAEKWSKKKGSATATFTGHTTDHFIDGVPVQKKEYDTKITELADEQIFRLLTDPIYFNTQLHWQKRRELLLQVCGDISDDEVIASKNSLSELKDVLKDRTIEQHKKVVQARRAELNREIDKIPVRIDEVKSGLPRIDDIANEKELLNDISKLQEELKKKQEELAQVNAGGVVAEKTKKLRLIESQIIDLKNTYQNDITEKVYDKQTELSKLSSEIYNRKNYIESENLAIQSYESRISSLNEKLEKLRSDWRTENEKAFEFEQSDICPTCGQQIPEERLQEIKNKARVTFNLEKSEKLETINKDGKSLANDKAFYEKAIENSRTKIDQTQKELTELEQRESILKAEIDSIMKGSQPIESTPKFIELYQQTNTIREEIRKLQADNSIFVAAVQKEINTISDAIKSLEQARMRIETYNNGLKRIEELKVEERKLASEYENLEKQLFLTEEFIRTKVKLLESKINSKFKMARFKLFNTLVNGGVEECCETMFNGVPYSNLNNGARLNIGLDIINTLAEHYNFAPPVWLDNAESVTDILTTKGQQIRLIVSEPDKRLRIEKI